MADVSHGSLFATTQFKRLQKEIPDSSMCTFANCRFDATSQKYITLWYTNDAARVLDTLNGPEYQCNHKPGTHVAVAGGRDSYGFWLSTDTASYLRGLCAKLSMAFTFARTGDPSPLSIRSKKTAIPSTDENNLHSNSEPSDSTTEAIAIDVPSSASADVTPRRLSFPDLARSPSGLPPTVPHVVSPPAFPSRTNLA